MICEHDENMMIGNYYYFNCKMVMLPAAVKCEDDDEDGCCKGCLVLVCMWLHWRMKLPFVGLEEPTMGLLFRAIFLIGILLRVGMELLMSIMADGRGLAH